MLEEDSSPNISKKQKSKTVKLVNKSEKRQRMNNTVIKDPNFIETLLETSNEIPRDELIKITSPKSILKSSADLTSQVTFQSHTNIFNNQLMPKMQRINS